MNDLVIREFMSCDAKAVEGLFAKVNRSIAPDGMKDRFETYIENSMREEIGRIEDYYKEHNGQFWVAYKGDLLAGMVGMECYAEDAVELRRMYVSPEFRRQGHALRLLTFVEDWCRDHGWKRLVLSTSELQPAAMNLYQVSGFEIIGDSVSNEASNKTIGGGIARRYYQKIL